MEVTHLLLPPPSPLRDYGLIFLLGSLAVSSLSDIRRLAAQADFAEVWAAFTATMFLTDVYMGLTDQLSLPPFILKWALIAFVTLATASHTLNVSTMDQAAIAALLSILNPAYILLSLILLFISNELLNPIMRRYGEAGAYPFLPTVFTVNLLILAVILAGGIEPYIIMSETPT